MALHVRCKALYIFSPSSAKQEREMTKFCVVRGTCTTTANFSYFHLPGNERCIAGVLNRSRRRPRGSRRRCLNSLDFVPPAMSH